MKRFSIVFLIGWLFFCTSGNSTVQAAEILRIGTVLLPPWGYFDEQGKPQGILYDVANRIAEELGRDYHNQVLPAARLLRDLEYNLIDFTIIYRTPNSERIGIPIAKIYPGIQNIVIGRNGLDISAKEQLYRHVIAVPRGGKFGEPFDSDPRVQRLISNEYMHSLRLLMGRKVDMVVGSRQTLFFCAAAFGLDLDFFGSPYLLTITDEWVHIAKDGGDRVDPERLKTVIERLRRNGEFERLAKKYLPPIFYKTEVHPGRPWPNSAK